VNDKLWWHIQVLLNIIRALHVHMLEVQSHYSSTYIQCKLISSFTKQRAYKSCDEESDFLQLGEATAVSLLVGGGLPGEGTEGEGNTTAIAAAGRAPKFLWACDRIGSDTVRSLFKDQAGWQTQHQTHSFSFFNTC
jgi:hypothetical protein